MIQAKSDSQIQQEVLRELKWDSRVEETEIGVTVQDAIVTLTGTVSEYAKKVAAREAAHRVVGVLDVADQILVRVPNGTGRTDAEIAQAIRQALEWDVWVPEDRIQSTVSNGWVTLEGSVRYLRERDDVERAIRNLAGVKGITNSIVIDSGMVDEDDVRLVIEDALERRADREAGRIQVAVEDGTVTLEGRVRSWEEKRAVVGAVSHAPGVRAVADRLYINPYC
jgi:osmotically-inducible protein OsmY